MKQAITNVLMTMCMMMATTVSYATTGADMLAQSSMPRAIALGHAYTAAADIQSLDYNPAGLAYLEKLNIIAGFNSSLIDSTQMIAIARPIRAGGVTAGSVSYRGLPEIDNDGAVDDPIKANDIMVTLSYARLFQLNKKKESQLAAGLSFKWLRTVLGDYQATAIAFDFGLHGHPEFLQDLQLGVSLQNLGPSIKFIEAEDQLPLLVRLGGHYQLIENTNHHLIVLADGNYYINNEVISLNFGTEYIFHKLLAARLGVQYQENSLNSTIYAGLGAQYTIHTITLRLDYTFKPINLSDQQLETEHTVALTGLF